MNSSKIKARTRTALDLCLNRVTRADVHYVVENAAWSIRHDGTMITQSLPSLKGRITVHPNGLKNTLIHFGSIHTWLRRGQAPRTIDPSNKVIVTWFHVEEGDPRVERLAEIQHHADLWHTSCSITQNVLVNHGVPEEKIRRIPLGVDTRVFSPVEDKAEKSRIRQMLGVPPDAKVIGSFQKDGVGWGEGLEPKLIKGPDIFCDVLEEVARKESIFVLLTGPARGYVRQRLEKAGIPHMHRNIPNPDQLVPFYRALDLYLITSRVEGGPKPLIEAMACGIPVVTTSVGMVPDLVQDGNEALIGDAQDLADRCVEALNKEPLCATLSQNGLHMVQALDWRRIAQRYEEELYQPFLG